MPMQHTLRHYTTKNLMAKAFCSLRKTISVGTAYISLMSRKPRFPPQRQLTLLAEIYECAKAGAQFFIVTHSPILLGIPDADIYCFDRDRLHLCDYEETGSYQITKMFVNNRQALLRNLLND